MGITVISSPAVANAGQAASGSVASLATDGIAIDCAALLKSQLSGQEALFGGAVATSKNQQESHDRFGHGDQGSDIIDEMLATQDPGLANQLVTPYIPPTLENRLPLDVDRNKGLAGNKVEPEIDLDSRPQGKDNTNPATLALDPKALSISDASRLHSALSTTGIQPRGEAAIIAGESASGNNASPTFSTIMAGHAAQQTQQNAPGNAATVSTPLQDNRWAQDFGERIVWIAKNDQQVAQININPAQLGPVQITLNLSGDQASLSFASPHAEVRKAIEDAMPNLREMLSSAGISLGQSNVGAQLPQQQQDTNTQFANGKRSAGENAILPADNRAGSPSSGLPIQRGRGLVDLFA